MRPSCSNGPSLSCELHQVTHSITTTNTVTRDSPNTMVITFSEPVWGFTIADITVTNAVALIKNAQLPFVDVFKIDIDSFDCDVLPRVLQAYTPVRDVVYFDIS